ncbi:hypothetical protein EB118_13730 [bacterium]|nr:hypothetical protein [bacterium]NDD84604.1 hypothetical protein [bacterium]NDG31114.1 hypothetical protein [bacterium]
MSSQTANIHINYGMVSVKRDPVWPSEVSTKHYVDTKWVVGDIKHSVRNTDHMGWLVCDGRSLSRDDYPELFAVIGTAFGNSSGTTFNLPNCSGRVIGTVGTGAGLSARALGDKVGAETHTLTVGEMPSHSHTINDPGHTHSYVNNVNDQAVHTLTTQSDAADQVDINATTGSSTTGITINNTGGGGAHNNMQPTIFMGNVFIHCGKWTINEITTTLV